MSICWDLLNEDFQAADNERNLFQKVTVHVADMGFEYCSCLIRIPSLTSSAEVRILDNYPTCWAEQYKKQGYLAIDPTIDIGMRETRLIVWTDEVFESAPQILADAREHGLNFGMSYPSWSSNGVFGLLSVARRSNRIESSEVCSFNRQMSWLAGMSHVRFAQLLIPKLAPSTKAFLTDRERDVLRWTIEGKTADEIGTILGITGRTANFHISNILRKLGATNKAQAVAKAVAIGLIQAD